MRPELIKMSKLLSLVLRHNPAHVGISLDAAGWVEIETLVAAFQRAGKRLDHALLLEIVETNEKQRYALSDDGTRIRASQGHSIPIDLGLTPTPPPPFLYHGTARQFLPSIRAEGLRSRSRLHVHLSSDTETAIEVGKRHGEPVVLVIEAERAAQADLEFSISENRVWLVEKVPVEFIRFPE